jgi:hypothetical protein
VRSFLILGALLAFPTVPLDAQGVVPLGSLSAEDAAGFGSLTLNSDNPIKDPPFCTVSFLSLNKLKTGMTYEQVRDLMGCEPNQSYSVPNGDWTITKMVYFWSGRDRIQTSFIDGHLSDFTFTRIILDSFGFDPEEGQRAEFLRRWLDIRRKETE